ncbi:MAG: hypothetical protein V3R45_00255 [Candidatus Aminicenantaceae bacterium]
MKIKMLLRNQKLQMCVCLILVMFMVSSISFALGNQDEELQKKYAAILGEYEFDLSEFGGEPIVVEFRVDSGSLWADSGDGQPTTLEPIGDEPYEFTADDPESGALEIKFVKDDEGKYTICTIALLDQGAEISGNKIKQ